MFRFALGEQFMGVKYAMRVIRETYHAWKKLVSESGTSAGTSHPLVRQLSVPQMAVLDVTTDHVAVSVLMGPDGTPRLPPMAVDLTQVQFKFAALDEAEPAAVNGSGASADAPADSGALEF